jgi:hypothetical protein
MSSTEGMLAKWENWISEKTDNVEHGREVGKSDSRRIELVFHCCLSIDRLSWCPVPGSQSPFY